MWGSTKRLLRRFVSSARGRITPPGRDFSLNSGGRQVGKRLEEIRGDHIARYGLVRDDVLREISLSRNGLGVDVFCGNGYGVKILSGIPNTCILGIDGSEDAIRFAETHFAAANSFFTYKRYPFFLPAAVADFVACIESVEHVEQHEEFFGAVVSLLRPGGVLYVSVPNELRVPFSPSRFPFHHRHFTVAELRSLAARNNSTVERVWSQNVYEALSEASAPLVPLSDAPMMDGEGGQWLVAKVRKGAR